MNASFGLVRPLPAWNVFPNRRKPADFSFPDLNVNWAGYLRGIQPVIADAVRGYANRRARSWKADNRVPLTHNLLSQLCGFLRFAEAGTAREIVPKKWFAYVAARSKEQIKPATLNRTLWELRSFLRYLQDERIPICEKMLAVRPSKTGKPLPRALSENQVRALLGVIANPLDRAWILLMLYGGLRTCEVRALRWEDVDLRARTVRIEESKGLRSRAVFLNPRTVQALAGLPGNSGYVFTYRGKPLSARYCQSHLQTLGKRCGVKVTPHQLRHCCATFLLNAGMSVFAVQKILGHRHVETTLRYAKVYDSIVARDFMRAYGKEESQPST